MQDHNVRVQAIARQVKSFNERREEYRIYHGTTSTTRKTKLSRSRIVDTRGLNHVLSVDPRKRVAMIEPNVSMEQLVDATLAYGLLPPVVMEFPAITAGGGFAGTAGESSSFRHGLFDKTVTRIDIVLADGEIVQASVYQRPDLFHGAAGSFGTFGIITLLELQLIVARPFVELSFWPISNMDEAVQRIEALSAQPRTEYLEGILFDQCQGVIICGCLTDQSDSTFPVFTFTRAHDSWFYLHARDVLRTKAHDYRELVPIKDYLFRYDRGAFWSGMYAFRYFLTPFNAVTRWALDSLMRAKVMYQALHKSRIADQYIVQDIGFPYDTVGQFVQYLHHTLGFYPLWLCPVKIDKEMSLHPRTMAPPTPDARSPGMILNVGLWGPGPTRYDKFVVVNRELEREVARLGGLKCLYAQAFYTEQEFWSIYDREWYDALRHKYKASTLPSVYEKVVVDLSKWMPLYELPWRQWMYQRFKEQWPVRGVYGVLKVLFSREYLLA